MLKKLNRTTNQGVLDHLAKGKPAQPYIDANQGTIRGDFYTDTQRQIDDLNSQSASLGSGFLGLGKGSRDAARADIRAQVSKLTGMLTGSKAAFGAIDAQQGPSMTKQSIARLKALDSESQASSLAEDPLFQGDRARMVSGGANALAGLGYDRKMSRLGTGSVQDVYDRLGVQLSQLGQQSRGVKEAKRDVVADSYQAFADAEKNFANARKNAEAAVITGNLDQAYGLIQKAADAEAKMRRSQEEFQNKILGEIYKSGSEAAATAFGGPQAMAGLGKSQGTTTSPTGDMYTKFSSGAMLPGEEDPFSPMAPSWSRKR